MKPIITIILIIIVGAASFFAGMKYSENNVRQRFANGQGGQFFRRQGGTQPVLGEIAETDGNSITVKMQDGSSKIVILSSSTSINKASTGTKDDLKQGERVAVFGTQNSDGSVTAQNVQLNPQMRRFGGTPNPQGSR